MWPLESSQLPEYSFNLSPDSYGPLNDVLLNRTVGIHFFHSAGNDSNARKISDGMNFFMQLKTSRFFLYYRILKYFYMFLLKHNGIKLWSKFFFTEGKSIYLVYKMSKHWRGFKLIFNQITLFFCFIKEIYIKLYHCVSNIQSKDFQFWSKDIMVSSQSQISMLCIDILMTINFNGAPLIYTS